VIWIKNKLFFINIYFLVINLIKFILYKLNLFIRKKFKYTIHIHLGILSLKKSNFLGLFDGL
jgi:hypothetical protein